VNLEKKKRLKKSRKKRTSGQNSEKKKNHRRGRKLKGQENGIERESNPVKNLTEGKSKRIRKPKRGGGARLGGEEGGQKGKGVKRKKEGEGRNFRWEKVPPLEKRRQRGGNNRHSDVQRGRRQRVLGRN